MNSASWHTEGMQKRCACVVQHLGFSSFCSCFFGLKIHAGMLQKLQRLYGTMRFQSFSNAFEKSADAKVQAHQLGSFHWAPSPKPAMHMEHLGSITNRRMGVKLCKETAILHQPFEFAPYWEHQAQEMVFQAPATETCLCCTTKHRSVSTIVSLMVWWKSSIQTHAHNSAQLVDL